MMRSCVALLLGASLSASAWAQSKPPLFDISVEAVVITAGPYGEFWDLKIDQQANARFEVWWRNWPPGNMEGSFLLNTDDVEKIAVVAEKADFFALPAKMHPRGVMSLHAPDFRLQMMVRGRSHKVELYQPNQVEDRAQVDRFMTVWNAVFDLLPSRLRPTVK